MCHSINFSFKYSSAFVVNLEKIFSQAPNHIFTYILFFSKNNAILNSYERYFTLTCDVRICSTFFPKWESSFLNTIYWKKKILSSFVYSFFPKFICLLGHHLVWFLIVKRASIVSRANLPTKNLLKNYSLGNFFLNFPLYFFFTFIYLFI